VGNQDEDLKASFLPSLTAAARSMDQVASFTPLLNYLSDGELERSEKEREKDYNRRRKRTNRGRRGVNLPDREPIRTHRTPAIGFPELDAATLAAVAAANAPMSRRAAAAAASVTIANMVASENSGSPTFLPQTIMPSVPQPTPTAVPKEKKPKGLFKAPTFPETVKHPRAAVTAPTPSTAADVSSLPAPLENDPPTVPSSVAAHFENKAPKPVTVTAKRAKELEREAKEKEFADGQHPNMINGVWHCSNCGCPENIAIGRRKGPLGDKSQCGVCGKFWHRHRRPRPVEYNTDPDFHSGAKREAEIAKSMAKKKGGAAALRAQSSTVPNSADVSESQTPAPIPEADAANPQSSPVKNAPEDDRATSPVSTASSTSESPLAHRVKLNGVNHATPASTPKLAPAITPAPPTLANPPSAPSTPSLAPPPGTKPSSSKPASSKPAPSPAPPKKKEASSSTSAPTPAEPSAPAPPKTWPPQWLSNAMQAMQAKYANDKFDVTLRKVNATSLPEWRIKCLDCPGKLYTPGPGETLSNYEVHLKNRQHRQRVNDRLNNANS